VESRWARAVLPGREANAKPVAGSKALPSVSSPIGSVVLTVPVSAFTIAIILLLLQPMKMRRCAVSIPRPAGAWQGAIE